MTYFTDSVYERMMVQKPIYGGEKTSSDSKSIKHTKKDKQKQYRERIFIPKKIKIKSTIKLVESKTL